MKAKNRMTLMSIDKFHLECHCINGSIVNGFPETLLYSFALTSPTGRKYKENQESNFLNR